MLRTASTPALYSPAVPYVDIQTRQNAVIDTRTVTQGVEDIRTYTPYGVSDTYVPVNIQTDTYTAGQIVTDNYVNVGTAPTVTYAAAPTATYAAPTTTYA